MLFPYTYVPHQMEKMHAFIDFIFHEIWCKAPAGGEYSLDLFVANPELHEVMTAFHYDDSNGAEFFSGHVERIYSFFSDLSDAQISQFQQWYQGNNDLEGPVSNFVFKAYDAPKENVCLANRKPRWQSCRQFPPSCLSSSAMVR